MKTGHLWGGTVWYDKDIAANDKGHSIIEKFISEHLHNDWTLSIYDTNTFGTIEVDCLIKDIPYVVSLVYDTECASSITFVGENPLSESYVIGMELTKGTLNVPGIYNIVNGKLIPAF